MSILIVGEHLHRLCLMCNPFELLYYIYICAIDSIKYLKLKCLFPLTVKAKMRT